jgi:hypothetical protein
MLTPSYHHVEARFPRVILKTKLNSPRVADLIVRLFTQILGEKVDAAVSCSSYSRTALRPIPPTIGVSRHRQFCGKSASRRKILPSSLVQLHTAVWTGSTRDTGPCAAEFVRLVCSSHSLGCAKQMSPLGGPSVGRPSSLEGQKILSIVVPDGTTGAFLRHPLITILYPAFQEKHKVAW